MRERGGYSSNKRVEDLRPPPKGRPMSAGDRDTLTGRISNHDPAELNAVAALVTEGAGPDRHPLFSLRYGIAVAILESDWLAARVRAAQAQAWDEGWANAVADKSPRHPLNPYELGSGDTEQSNHKVDGR